MLKSLYTLSKQYKNRKIVIYGVNRSSVIVFAKLVLNHQIDVYSFWDADDRYVGEYFVNRRIISTEQLYQITDAIIIIPEGLKKNVVRRRVGDTIDILYPDEILDLNQGLKEKKIYIYGCGKCGSIIYDKLQGDKVEIEGVCVTMPDRIDRWCGKDVIPIAKIEQDDNCAVILATERQQFQKEMLEQLEGIKAEKYISFFMSDEELSEGNFFQVINLAMLKQKGIWLYCDDNEYLSYLQDIFARYQINISKRIFGEEIFDLEYEDASKLSVVIVENDVVELERVCDTLDSMGFGLEQWDYTATAVCTYAATAYTSQKRDVLIGVSTYENKKYPGYVVYGNEKNANVRIMILGGSTSTEGVYRTTSWGKFFYEKLLKAGYRPLIFNGAVCSHGIVDEFLHMIRDIEPLKPDYIISFSGVNNTYDRKTKNQFNTREAEYRMTNDNDYISGIESDETLYDFWCRISRLMKLAAGQHGTKTYHFLQPMSTVKEDLDLVETGMFDYVEHTKNIRAFKARASVEKDMFYINLISILEEKKQAYIDHSHYSTEANKIIAEYIFNVMKSDIFEDIGEK